MKKICFVVATPMTARGFLRDHFRALSEFYEITLVANFDDNPSLRTDFPGIQTIHAPIQRKISIIYDLKALFSLIRIFRAEMFASVHSVTPKAGLLSMLAARIVRAPLRFHMFTGQVWATQKGFFRLMLKFLDTLTFRSATEVLVDSRSQRDFLVSEGVVLPNRAGVLADGSICGVDLERFVPSQNARFEVRARHVLKDDAFVFLFLGRINNDKGLVELIRGFRQSGCARNGAILMLVGPEEDDVLFRVAEDLSFLGGSVIRVGFTDSPQDYMAAADVFCLPSHREGFGSVIIEAAACGVPALASNIYGVSDAVEDGVTGVLHPVKDKAAIAKDMRDFMTDPTRLHRFGEQARIRANTMFSRERVVSAMVDFYRKRVGDSI